MARSQARSEQRATPGVLSILVTLIVPLGIQWVGSFNLFLESVSDVGRGPQGGAEEDHRRV